jgi:hypothetical protein
MHDRDIERIAADLGRRAGDDLDVERVAAAVVGRLRAAGGPARPAPWGRWLALAASLAVAAGTGYLTFGTPGTPPPAPVAIASPVLDALTATELGEVLDSLILDAPLAQWAGTTLNDLDAAQLAELLAILEG